MAQLDTYGLPDLVGLEKDKEGCDIVVPGRPVRHKEDEKSYGVCVSRRWVWNDKPMQCEVLWSRQPQLRPATAQAQVPSRVPLQKNWTLKSVDTHYGHDIRGIAQKEYFEVEEEYEYLSYDEIKKLHEEGADIQLHSSGGATVKRRTNELPERPNVSEGRVRRWTAGKRNF